MCPGALSCVLVSKCLHDTYCSVVIVLVVCPGCLIHYHSFGFIGCSGLIVNLCLIGCCSCNEC